MINMKELFKMLMPQIILIIIIYIILATLPYKNIISINLTIIIMVLMYKLRSEINNKQKPEIKTWLKTIITIAIWTTAILLLYDFLGSYGIIGAIIIILILVILRLWKGRKLFNYTTKWGANMLKGRKEEFDISKLEPEKMIKR